MRTTKQLTGELGELLVVRRCACPKCKRLKLSGGCRQISSVPTSFAISVAIWLKSKPVDPKRSTRRPKQFWARPGEFKRIGWTREFTFRSLLCKSTARMCIRYITCQLIFKGLTCSYQGTRCLKQHGVAGGKDLFTILEGSDNPLCGWFEQLRNPSRGRRAVLVRGRI